MKTNNTTVRHPTIGGKNNVHIRFFMCPNGLHVGVCAASDEDARKVLAQRYPGDLVWRRINNVWVDELLTDSGARLTSHPYTVLVRDSDNRTEWPDIVGVYPTADAANAAISKVKLDNLKSLRKDQPMPKLEFLIG